MARRNHYWIGLKLRKQMDRLRTIEAELLDARRRVRVKAWQLRRVKKQLGIDA